MRRSSVLGRGIPFEFSFEAWLEGGPGTCQQAAYVAAGVASMSWPGSLIASLHARRCGLHSVRAAVRPAARRDRLSGNRQPVRTPKGGFASIAATSKYGIRITDGQQRVRRCEWNPDPVLIHRPTPVLRCSSGSIRMAIGAKSRAALGRN
jgi:hypothetical protein